MKKRDPQIDLEIKERRKHYGHLLSAAQYELLRLRGMSKTQVEDFETKLHREIDKRNEDPMFIPSLWVQYRADGYEPKDIEYDWVYAFR